MATYSHLEVANSPTLEWIELTAFISSITPTQVILTNSDGTLTVLTGTGFAGTLGTAGPPSTLGTLTAGEITAASRTDAGQTITYEGLSGFTLTSGDFTVAASLGGLQGVAASVLNLNDTLNGYSGRDFFKGFAGNDTMNGGGELDTVRYSGPFHSGAISVVMSAVSTVTGNASAGVDTLVSVEQVIGSNSNAGDDYFANGTFSGSFGTFNMFEGRGGPDRITGNGNTRLSYNEATGGVVIDMVAGTAVGDASVGSDTFTGVNSILGSQLADDVTGNGLANTLIGQGGDDTLRGAGGDDTINGGDGNDLLVGGGGADSLVGGLGEDIFRGLAGNDIFVGSGAAPNRDTADYSFDATNGGTAGIRVNQDDAIVQGGIAPDTAIDGFGDTDSIVLVVNITATEFGDEVYGGEANNRLQLNSGNDYAFGGLGNDSLLGGLGVDTLEGGQGDDIYFIDVDADVVIEQAGQGTDTVNAAFNYAMIANIEALILQEGTATDGLANDNGASVTGNANNNNLTGGAGSDTLSGLVGNDRLDGGAGVDSMSGGQGDDTFYVDNVADVTTEISGEGNDAVFATVNAVLGANIETLYLVEGSAATAGQAHNGGAGIVGNSAINNLTGGTGNDTLLGLGGNDQIDGGIGADNMSGGQGDDTFFVDNSADLTSEVAGQGNDTAISTVNFVLGSNVETHTLVEGSAATDGLAHNGGARINGNSNNNNLTGGAGNDTLSGEAGSDRIDGSAGNDSMVGGTGTDFYYVDSAGDIIVETAAGEFDVVYSSAATFTMSANLELFIALGGAGAVGATGNGEVNYFVGNDAGNTFAGLGGSDMIFGGLGNDTIDGGASDGAGWGYDLIFGGAGADQLTSGGGTDYFVYEAITDGGDTITDFATNAGAEDDILDFRPLWGTFTNTAGITNVAQAVASGHVTFTQAGADVQVFADADGGGNNNVLMATILNQTAASAQAYSLI